MTSPLYHGAVLCVSHTAADHGPTNHCRRMEVVHVTMERMYSEPHVAIYGVLLMKKRHYCMLAGDSGTP